MACYPDRGPSIRTSWGESTAGGWGGTGFRIGALGSIWKINPEEASDQASPSPLHKLVWRSHERDPGSSPRYPAGSGGRGPQWGPVRMAVRLAESLVELRRFDPQDILDRYLAWWRDGAFDTGPTTATALSLIDGGMDAAEAVERVHDQAGGMTAGCNPAHRCAPLAMAPFLPDDELAGCALREARLTHQHPLAGDVAAAVAVLCRALIRGEPWCGALDVARRGRLPLTIQALDGNNPYPLSPAGYAPEVLRAAIHFVDCHGSFRCSQCLARLRRSGELLPGPRRGRRRGEVGSDRHHSEDADRVRLDDSGPERSRDPGE
jgi:hypothetical protein